MKPKFTDEQLDYLKSCADTAYTKRWKIGKDHFAGLEQFIPYFIWSLKQEKGFDELLSEARLSLLKGRRLHPGGEVLALKTVNESGVK